MPAGEKANQTVSEVIKGIDNPRLMGLFPLEMDQLKMEIELVQGCIASVRPSGLPCRQTDTSIFGSAINNFRGARNPQCTGGLGSSPPSRTLRRAR